MWNKKFPIINFSLEPLWLQTTDPVSPNPPPPPNPIDLLIPYASTDQKACVLQVIPCEFRK